MPPLAPALLLLLLLAGCSGLTRGPGGLVPERFGKTTRDLDASREMWRFFQRFTLPSP